MNQAILTEHGLMMRFWLPLMELQFDYAFQCMRNGNGNLESILRNLTMTWFWVPWSKEDLQSQLPMQQRRLYHDLLRNFTVCFEAHRADADSYGFSGPNS